jgi:CheY-like chemotaxis protein
MPSDQRRWQRFTVPAKILVAPKAAAPYEARIQDISPGCAFVLSDRSVAFREALVLTFFPGDATTSISVGCEVVHMMTSGFGAEFSASTPPDVRDAIDAWISELSGELASRRAVSPSAASSVAPSTGVPPSGAAARPPIPRAGSSGRTSVERQSDVDRSPSSREKPAGPKGVAADQPAAPKILLVQDDRQLARLLINLLEKAGAVIVGVHESTEVRGVLDREKFHLALIDWLPADGTPENLIATIRARSPKLPIVVVSALANNPDFRAHAIALGATDFVKKPFQLKELILTLEPLLNSNTP